MNRCRSEHLGLRFRGPATEPENRRIPKIRKKYKIPHPGLAPENTKKIAEKYKNRPKKAILGRFRIFPLFFPFFGGQPGVGDFVLFFVFSAESQILAAKTWHLQRIRQEGRLLLQDRLLLAVPLSLCPLPLVFQCYLQLDFRLQLCLRAAVSVVCLSLSLSLLGGAGCRRVKQAPSWPKLLHNNSLKQLFS